MAATLDTMPKMETTGNQVANWTKWKRALGILIDAKEIKDEKVKKSLLLHYGGLDIQEIYYSMVNDFPTKMKNAKGEEVDKSPYQIAMDVLDAYFLPKSNATIERKEFRQLKQNDGESINEFIVRIKTKADKCEFTDINEQIRDQVIYGTRHPEIETKLIEKGSVKIGINDIIAMIQAVELKEARIHKVEMIKTNKTHHNNAGRQRSKSRDRSYSRYSSNDSASNHNRSTMPKTEITCYRCGQTGHMARDSHCPAWKKKCDKCNKYGHLKKVCRTRVNKAVKFIGNEECCQNEQQSDDSQILSMVEVNKPVSTRSGNSMIVDKIDNKFDGGIKVTCTVGGIKIRMTVDSGASTNLISQETYNKAVKRGMTILKEFCDDGKCLKAYGGRDIRVLKKIRTTIECNGMKRQIDITIVEGEGTSLLGLEDSLRLNLISINVNMIESSNKTGKLKNIQVEIELDDTIKPVRQALRRVPLPLRDKVAKKLKEYMEDDIIEKVDGTSRWISPLVVIPKDKGKDVRLCIDMRRANEAVKKEVHPLPTFEDLIPQLHHSMVFSKLDIKNAFHQVEISPSSRDITTFITDIGLFRFKRLIFGLNSASEIFQRLIENLFINVEGVLIYIDDILVFGETEEKHDATLKKVMEIIKNNGLVLNNNKCHYRKPQVTFMGHIISKEGISPTLDRVKDIQLFRAPRTKEEMRSFLGLLNYVGRFIPNLATLMEPLKVLTRKDEKFHWTDKLQSVFNMAKKLIMKETKLGFYNKNDKTTIIADASPVALGAVLMQENGGQPRIIAYASKGLTSVERNYSQTEKEALAIVWAAEKFRMYVMGKRFDMITDHKSLETLFKSTSKPCARIERWILRLQAFNMRVIYKPGKTNLADPLSRLCEKESEIFDDKCEMYINLILNISKPKAMTLEEIESETQKDDELVLLMDTLQKSIDTKYWPEDISQYKRYVDELSVINGVILRHNRIVIPRGLQEDILRLAHEGHPGENMMKRRLRIKVWWYGMDKQAVEFVKGCNSCQIVGKAPNPEPLRIIELPKECWYQIRIDIMGPVPSGHNILVTVDSYSRYVLVDILTTITSEKVIKSLQNMFIRFGLPTIIISDNASYFKSKEFKEFAEEYNIMLRHTIPYSPQSNGEVERQNLSLLKRLKIAGVQGTDWKEELNDWLRLYNNSTHPSTSAIPSQVMFNRVFREKLPSIDTKPEIFDEDMRYNDREMKLKRKEYVDIRRQATTSKITEGDKVLKQNERIINKLTPTYDPEPCKVLSRNGNAVLIEDGGGKQSLKRADQLKLLKENIQQEGQEVITTASSEVIDQPQIEIKEPLEMERRTPRIRKTPKYLEEYVVNQATI